MPDVDLDLVLRRATDHAFGVEDADNEGKLIWLPKSLTTDLGDGQFRMPEWLAIEKGLV